jgi:hypothetical protein
MYSNTEDWQAIRKAPQLVSLFAAIGDEIVQDLNQELHAAQARRKQKVEDGYKFAISHDDDRIRMRIWAFTARAAAHEAKHQSILKHMKFVGQTKRQGGRARNPGPNFGSRGSKRRGSKKTSGRRTTSRPPRSKATSGPKMDARREATLRRQLAALDILSEQGSTEGERNSASEAARRVRKRLGE